MLYILKTRKNNRNVWLVLSCYRWLYYRQTLIFCLQWLCFLQCLSVFLKKKWYTQHYRKHQTYWKHGKKSSNVKKKNNIQSIFNSYTSFINVYKNNTFLSIIVSSHLTFAKKAFYYQHHTLMSVTFTPILHPFCDNEIYKETNYRLSQLKSMSTRKSCKRQWGQGSRINFIFCVYLCAPI